MCGREVRNYVALAQHLRFNSDAEHTKLKADWTAWKAEYRATLRCRKCGELFEISDKALRNQKRCPRCEQLRSTLSRRRYEALHFDKPVDPRKAVGRESKAQWDGLEQRRVVWAPGDDLYQRVVRAIESGERINSIRFTLGLPYKVIKEVAIHAFGDDYAKHMYDRKAEQGRQTIKLAHAWWDGLSDSEKAHEMKRRFGGTCQLEASFAQQLRTARVGGLEMNSWQTLRIGEKKQPREADIKISIGDGRKIVVLCDGEAFHGPKTIHGNPAERIENDRQTALAFYDLGYTVVRYSESEIHDGRALVHLQDTMKRLARCQRIYRNWHPHEEQVV